MSLICSEIAEMHDKNDLLTPVGFKAKEDVDETDSNNEVSDGNEYN